MERRGDLVAELEFLENILDIGGETIQVGFKIGFELLLTGTVSGHEG